MKALVWAAGFGTRLLPLTKTLPKPLFPVVNIPMIDLILRYLKSYGISEAGINTHYLRELFVPYLKKIQDMKLLITEEKEEILGTGGGTVPFRDFLKGEDIFIVHTSDILTTIDLNDAIKFHREQKNMVTLILVDHKPINHVSILKDGTIVDIANKLGRQSEPDIINLAGSALSIYNNEIFRYLPDEKKYFEINPILLEIIKKEPGKIKGYIPQKPFYWRDIGTVHSYWEAHRDILLNKLYRVMEITDNQTHIRQPSSQIGRGVTFEGFSVVGKKVLLRGEMKIKNSIIWDGVEIRSSEKIENSIITKECTITL